MQQVGSRHKLHSWVFYCVLCLPFINFVFISQRIWIRDQVLNTVDFLQLYVWNAASNRFLLVPPRHCRSCSFWVAAVRHAVRWVSHSLEILSLISPILLSSSQHYFIFYLSVFLLVWCKSLLFVFISSLTFRSLSHPFFLHLPVLLYVLLYSSFLRVFRPIYFSLFLSLFF
jgi:hypothetical protein